MMKIKLFVIIFCFCSMFMQAAIRVRWEAYPDAVGYVVFRADNNAFPLDFHQISSTNELVTTTFFMDEGLFYSPPVGFKAFWYMIAAIDAQGEAIHQSIPECVVHYCHGDADLSGVVDIADAVLIERHIVGLVNLEDNRDAFLAADANLDGWVDAADSVLVKRFVVELDAQEAHCLVVQ